MRRKKEDESRYEVKDRRCRSSEEEEKNESRKGEKIDKYVK